MTEVGPPSSERTIEGSPEPAAHHGGPNRGPRMLLAVSILATVGWIVCIYFLESWDKSGADEVAAFRHWSWLVAVVILAVFLIGVGHHVTGHWRGLIIDDRHKISLSRMQLALWTILVLSAFANALVWNAVQDECIPRQRGTLSIQPSTTPGLWISGSPSNQDLCPPLDLAIPNDLLLLMGISAGALIGANVIKTDQQSKGKLHTNDHYSEADWTDILKAEGRDDISELDLGKVQMLLFTVVLFAGYAAVVLMEFARTDHFEFPALSGAAVGLLGISQIGYLATKAAKN